MSPPALFTPLTLRGVTLKNRIVLAPMQMYMTGPDGRATDWHFHHLAKYAVGGFGTVMTEALMVDPAGRNTYGDCGLWSDAHIAPLRRIADFIKANGAVAAAQLHHCGPKASRRRPWDGLGPLDQSDAAKGEAPWQPVAATGRETTAGWNVPRALTLAEIKRLVEAYGLAAHRAIAAGFDMIDIHAAHGYLIHTFLSPVSNERTDAYGGDRAGRMRLALEIAGSVRAATPERIPILFRISSVDWRADLDTRTDGWTIEDSCVLAGELRSRGIDVIDCSSGGIRAENSTMDFIKRRIPMKRGHQVPYAEAIRARTGVSTMAVGVILDGPQAEAIIRDGRADLVAIGREALFNPHWPLHAARALGHAPDWSLWPPSYGWWLEMRERTGVVD